MKKKEGSEASRNDPILYIAGAGGHAREVAWLAGECMGSSVRIVHLVTDYAYLAPSIDGNSIQLISSIIAEESSQYVAAVGCGKLRRQLANECEKAGLRAATLLYPTATISKKVQIGIGCIVGAGSILTTNVVLGEHVHVNIGCLISHDVTIGDFSTLSPGTKIAGHVQIGDGVFFGSGATVINGTASRPLVIGDNAIIAAGACVTNDVVAETMVAGVPAVYKR